MVLETLGAATLQQRMKENYACYTPDFDVSRDERVIIYNIYV